MTKKQVMLDALRFRPPAYVPWSWGMTKDCKQRMQQYLGAANLADFTGNHILELGASIARGEYIDATHFRDIYGVVWDRGIEPDIGMPVQWPIHREQDLDSYVWPNFTSPALYEPARQQMREHGDLLSRWAIGFSLYERAWTLFGMENLLIGMVEQPAFVEKLLDAIADHNLIQIHRALELGVDAVYFGDDYGSQVGLIMGIEHWRQFVKPRLARMFAPIRAAGKFITMHSCGCVQSLFDDLVEIGLNMFNPFQPDVMDVFALKKQYHGRLAFHGGMSVQNTLPFGSVQDVRDMTRRLIDAGAGGGYVFSPSHAVPRDVPPENLAAMMEELRKQKGYGG